MMLTLEQRAAFVEEAPEIFLPIPGGWEKMGRTHIRLAAEWPISNAGRDNLGGRQERVSLLGALPRNLLGGLIQVARISVSVRLGTGRHLSGRANSSPQRSLEHIAKSPTIAVSCRWPLVLGGDCAGARRVLAKS